MSTAWGRLPRPNPCLPCLVGNPRGRGRSREAEMLALEEAERARRTPRRGRNAEDVHIHVDMPRAHAAYGRGRTRETNRNPGMRISEKEKAILRDRGAGWYVMRFVWVDEGRGGKYPAYLGPFATKGAARDAADRSEHWRGHTVHEFTREDLGLPKSYSFEHANPRNPKLMVLNPGDPMVAACERVLRRRLSASEKSLLSKACREFKTFHGRAARPSDVVAGDVPPGSTPIVWGMGVEERKDYVVPIDSHRKGKWTHKAGDQGGRRHTRAPWVGVVPGRKSHNEVTVQVRGTRRYVKPTHGIMG